MDNAFLELQILDLPDSYYSEQTVVRVSLDTKQIREVTMKKMSSSIKTKLVSSNELIVFEILKVSYGKKETEIDTLLIPVDFFCDIPLSGRSTTGLPMRKLESWLYFEDDGYLKQ